METDLVTSDAGAYSIPLKPAVNPRKDQDIEAIPSDVEAAIKAAVKTGDVYSVTEDRQLFDGQILKVDILTFQERTVLVMTNFDVPWIAIVAKKLQFVDPTKNNAISTEAAWGPVRYNPPDAPIAPPKGGKAGECRDGPAGSPGSPGISGHSGDAGPRPPKIYLIVGNIVNQFNRPLPESLNFIFDARGYSGSHGGDGGRGGNGGEGGDGGPADWDCPDRYPGTPGCNCGAGTGGLAGREEQEAPGEMRLPVQIWRGLDRNLC
jgi:hypothetical protein